MKTSTSFSSQIFESRFVIVPQTSVSSTQKPKYRFSSSQSSATRVSNQAGSPVTMSTKGVDFGASCQEASSSLPSTTIGPAAR